MEQDELLQRLKNTEGNASFLRAARAGNIDKVQEYLKQGTDINTANANGLNALHLASKEGHVDLVQLLLKRGASVDAATKKGNTALHIACLAGQHEIVKILVESGGAVNVQSQNGFTPLYMAAQENHFEIVKYLLENNANQSLATEDGFTPLAVALQQGHDKVVSILLENDTRSKVRLPALHIAAKKDDVKAATLLLDADRNADVTSKSGFTPLHIAAHYGNTNIANLLLDRGADVNFVASKHNISALHVAAKWGRPAMVQLLLERGAEIDAKTRDGLTPLHCGARSGHDRVVDILLSKGSPNNPRTKNGLAPLHMAAQGDHVDSARALLYYKAPVDDVTVDYLTPLHVAAHCGHVRVAKLLLDRRADPNARALNGFTPLHIACKKNRIKVVMLLLKHGASIEATTESGLTPLHVASFMGCMNIVLYLIQHGSNPDVTTVRGETPLHLAVRSNQTDIIRILLRNGAKVDARARENQTPLHMAVRLGHMDNMTLLMQHGAMIDAQTKDLYTPLHIAAKEGQEECVAALIEQGANLTAVTRKGFTPLHLASKYGHIGTAKLLLDKGAPVDTPGKNGVTPLHVATHYDNPHVAHLLLERGASPQATAKNGYPPLHISAKKNQLDIAQTLLKYKSDPNAESKAGFTPVHLAAQQPGHTEMLQLLLRSGGEPNARAKNGLTPLHLAAQEDNVPEAEILVAHGAQTNPETKAGYTPLHVACHFGQINMVRYLLAQGADVNVKTSYGYTPLHQAAQQGHTQIINLLLQHQAQPNEINDQGQTALSIAENLGYISVVETLKVVTETIVTTTTTTVTEEKIKMQAPETMQEAFISDSEEEAERPDEEEENGLDRHQDAAISPARSVSPPRSPTDLDNVVYEEHVYKRETPGERGTRQKVLEGAVEDRFGSPTREGRKGQRGAKDAKRTKSPDYHAEFAYEGSGLPATRAVHEQFYERNHLPVTQPLHDESDEHFMETVIHNSQSGRGSRGPTSDFRQYETTVYETETIDSEAIPRRNIPDVVVVNERYETRSGTTSPFMERIPIRVDAPGEIIVRHDQSVPERDIVERYELVSPPPTGDEDEKGKKKRRWFSFGGKDKDKPEKEGKKKKKEKVAELASPVTTTKIRDVTEENNNVGKDKQPKRKYPTADVLREDVQRATLEADKRGRYDGRPGDDSVVNYAEHISERDVPDQRPRREETLREGVLETSFDSENPDNFNDKAKSFLDRSRAKKQPGAQGIDDGAREMLDEEHRIFGDQSPNRFRHVNEEIHGIDNQDGEFKDRAKGFLAKNRGKRQPGSELLEESYERSEAPHRIREVHEDIDEADRLRRDLSRERTRSLIDEYRKNNPELEKLSESYVRSGVPGAEEHDRSRSRERNPETQEVLAEYYERRDVPDRTRGNQEDIDDISGNFNEKAQKFLDKNRKKKVPASPGTIREVLVTSDSPRSDRVNRTGTKESLEESYIRSESPSAIRVTKKPGTQELLDELYQQSESPKGSRGKQRPGAREALEEAHDQYDIPVRVREVHETVNETDVNGRDFNEKAKNFINASRSKKSPREHGQEVLQESYERTETETPPQQRRDVGEEFREWADEYDEKSRKFLEENRNKRQPVAHENLEETYERSDSPLRAVQVHEDITEVDTRRKSFDDRARKFLEAKRAKDRLEGRVENPEDEELEESSRSVTHWGSLQETVEQGKVTQDSTPGPAPEIIERYELVLPREPTPSVRLAEEKTKTKKEKPAKNKGKNATAVSTVSSAESSRLGTLERVHEETARTASPSQEREQDDTGESLHLRTREVTTYEGKAEKSAKQAKKASDTVIILDEVVEKDDHKSPDRSRTSSRSSSRAPSRLRDENEIHLRETNWTPVPSAGEQSRVVVRTSETHLETPTKSAIRSSPRPGDRTDESLNEFSRTTTQASPRSLPKTSPRVKPKKTLSFSENTKRAPSISSVSSLSSATSFESSETESGAEGSGKLKRKPHVKKVKKGKKSKVAYQAVPTDESLIEGVTVSSSGRVKKPKEKKKRAEVIATEPLEDENFHVTVNTVTHTPDFEDTWAERRGRIREIGARGGKPYEKILQQSGTTHINSAEYQPTIEELSQRTLSETTTNGHAERPAPTPTFVRVDEAVIESSPDTLKRDKSASKLAKAAAEEEEKQRKKAAKEEKKLQERLEKEAKEAAKKREKQEKEERERLEKEERKKSKERPKKDKTPTLVVEAEDVTLAQNKNDQAERERLEKEAKKRAKEEKEERERLEKEERKKSKERLKKDKVPTIVVESEDTTLERSEKNKKPAAFSLSEDVEHIRSADSVEGTPVHSRSPSQSAFSPSTIKPGPSTFMTLEESQSQQRSPTSTHLRADEAHVKRTPSGVSGSRSKSPGRDKAVVELYETVTKADTLPRSGEESHSGDGVHLYETPWLPLNRDEDYPRETFESGTRTHEPATSPPEAMHYMQDDRHFVPLNADATGTMYVSGYSEGKMSPHEPKTSPPEGKPTRVLTSPTRVAEEIRVEAVRHPEPPTRVEISEMVRREDTYPEARKPASGANWQHESYEQILRDVETRKHEPNYISAVHGHEPEVRDDLHELEGTFTPDNVELMNRGAPVHGGKLRWKTFLVSFLVDARGGAMRGCRHSGIRVIIPPRKAPCPMRITCKYLTKDKIANPPPLMEGEGLACRILEMGPSSAKFLGPVIVEIPHFASLRDGEREISILRSENGQTWREHTLEATEDAVQKVLNESFDPNELSAIEDLQTNRIVRILTTDFPLYFAIISRIKQEVHAVGPDGGVITSTVENRCQALFPEGALTKKIKVGVQAHVVPPEIVARLLGNRAAVSPIVTVEPRRRKFHKPITLTIPLPRANGKGMVNQYTADSPNLRLLCSITGGTNPAQWEDITGSTPLVIVNDCIQFTTTVSARFWLMDCGHNINEAVKFGHTIYSEGCVVPFMAKFVVYARRFDNEEARLRVFCMTDDKEDKTLEHQERFVEVAKSRDVEVLEGKNLFIEMAGNLIPVTKSGDQLHLPFYPFQENRLPFLVKVKDPNEDAQGRLAFMKDSKSGRNELPQVPICNLSIRLPDELSLFRNSTLLEISSRYLDKQFYEPFLLTKKTMSLVLVLKAADETGPEPLSTLADSEALVLPGQDHLNVMWHFQPMEHTETRDLVTIVRRPVYMREVGKAGSVHKADVRLHDVADLLGDDWPQLAVQLGFREPEIQAIKEEEPKTQKQAFIMLRRWVSRRDSSKPAGNELEQALKRMNRDDVVNKVMFNVKLLTDDLDKSMARFSVDRDQMGFDALHEELGPPSHEGTMERTFVRDYAKGYRPELEPKRAESENASETTSLHEEDRESRTTETKETMITQLGDKLRGLDERHPTPTQTFVRDVEEPVREELFESVQTSDGRQLPTQTVNVTREDLSQTTQVRDVPSSPRQPPSPPSRQQPPSPPHRQKPPSPPIRAEVPLPPQRKEPPSPPRRQEPPSPPVRTTPPSPPVRQDSTPTHVRLEEHVTSRTEPEPESQTFVREANEPVADDNAQKTSSQQSHETVEQEYDEEGNLVTKKTVTTVKTTRTTRTILGDQDEIVKKATEGEFLRNVPGQRRTSAGEEERLQETVTRTSGPEITDVTDTYVKDAEEAHPKEKGTTSVVTYEEEVVTVQTRRATGDEHSERELASSSSRSAVEGAQERLYEETHVRDVSDETEPGARSHVRFQQETEDINDSISRTADKLVSEAVEAALDELSTEPQEPAVPRGHESNTTSSSAVNEGVKHQRPTDLFGSSEGSRVTFEHTVPIIETPSSQHPDFPRTPEQIVRGPSPVEITEEETGAETITARPIVQEPEEIRQRRESGSSVSPSVPESEPKPHVEREIPSPTRAERIHRETVEAQRQRREQFIRGASHPTVEASSFEKETSSHTESETSRSVERHFVKHTITERRLSSETRTSSSDLPFEETVTRIPGETVVWESSETRTSSTEEPANEVSSPIPKEPSTPVPATPPGSLDSFQTAQLPSLELSPLQMRRLSETAEAQQVEIEGQKRGSIRDSIKFFEQKARESTSPPLELQRKPSLRRTPSESSSSTTSARERTSPTELQRKLSMRRSPSESQESPRSSPPLRTYSREVSRTSIADSEDELRDISSIKEDLPSLEYEKAILEKQHSTGVITVSPTRHSPETLVTHLEETEEPSPVPSSPESARTETTDSRAESPESPKEGHVKDAIQRMESMIATTKAPPRERRTRKTSKTSRSSESTSGGGTETMVRSAELPPSLSASSSEEPVVSRITPLPQEASRVTVTTTSTPVTTEVTINPTRSFGDLTSETDSGHIESDEGRRLGRGLRDTALLSSSFSDEAVKTLSSTPLEENREALTERASLERQSVATERLSPVEAEESPVPENRSQEKITDYTAPSVSRFSTSDEEYSETVTTGRVVEVSRRVSSADLQKAAEATTTSAIAGAVTEFEQGERGNVQAVESPTPSPVRGDFQSESETETRVRQPPPTETDEVHETVLERTDSPIWSPVSIEFRDQRETETHVSEPETETYVREPSPTEREELQESVTERTESRPDRDVRSEPETATFVRQPSQTETEELQETVSNREASSVPASESPVSQHFQAETGIESYARPRETEERREAVSERTVSPVQAPEPPVRADFQAESETRTFVRQPPEQTEQLDETITERNVSPVKAAESSVQSPIRRESKPEAETEIHVRQPSTTDREELRETITQWTESPVNTAASPVRREFQPESDTDTHVRQAPPPATKELHETVTKTRTSPVSSAESPVPSPLDKEFQTKPDTETYARQPSPTEVERLHETVTERSESPVQSTESPVPSLVRHELQAQPDTDTYSRQSSAQEAERLHEMVAERTASPVQPVEPLVQSPLQRDLQGAAETETYVQRPSPTDSEELHGTDTERTISPVRPAESPAQSPVRQDFQAEPETETYVRQPSPTETEELHESVTERTVSPVRNVESPVRREFQVIPETETTYVRQPLLTKVERLQDTVTERTELPVEVAEPPVPKEYQDGIETETHVRQPSPTETEGLYETVTETSVSPVPLAESPFQTPMRREFQAAPETETYVRQSSQAETEQLHESVTKRETSPVPAVREEILGNRRVSLTEEEFVGRPQGSVEGVPRQPIHDMPETDDSASSQPFRTVTFGNEASEYTATPVSPETKDLSTETRVRASMVEAEMGEVAEQIHPQVEEPVIMVFDTSADKAESRESSRDESPPASPNLETTTQVRDRHRHQKTPPREVVSTTPASRTDPSWEE